MAVDALLQEWDPRLKALIGDGSPRAGERLAALALRAIDPAVRTATSTFLAHLTPADRADVAAMCRDRLTSLLRAVQRGDRSVPIADLDEFARTAAEGLCRDYLRRTRPVLARLGNRIRLLSTRGVGILGWTTEKGQHVLGLPAWTDTPPIEPPYSWEGRARDWWGKHHAAADGPALTPTVVRLLEQVGAPVPVGVAAALIAEITGIDDPGARLDASPEGDEPERAVLDAGVGSDHLAVARRYLDRAWRDLLAMPPQMRAALLLSLRDHHGTALLPVFHCAGVTPLRLVADALAMKADETAAIWAHLPWDDKAIGRRLGLTGLQVLNARTAARSRLIRHLAERDRL
ncbi:MAG: hypothetical protein AB7O28_01865 [Vicinamibacterales bacterium]